MQELSEEEMEEYLFGHSEAGSEEPARIYMMDYPEVAKHLLSFMKIKLKKQQYEIDDFRKMIEQRMGQQQTQLEQVAKESREYNMELHTELEEFVSNKKKEFYQKFIEIKKAKEEQNMIKSSFAETMGSMKQL